MPTKAELLAWIRERLPVAGGIFLTHGEDHARETLRDLLIAEGVPGGPHPPAAARRCLRAEGRRGSRSAAPRRRDVTGDQIERDWADDYVAFTQALAGRLDAMADETEKQALVKKLAAVLEERAAA